MRASTWTERETLFASVIFEHSALAGVEVLVLQDIERTDLTALSGALGVDLAQTYEDVRAAALPDRLGWLFEQPDSAEQAKAEQEEEALQRFLERLAFTRQIPLEYSPLQRWSLAEIWTTSASAGTAMGLGYVSGTTWPVVILLGAFGAILLRPLATVVGGIAEGVAEGSKEAFRSAAEKYAREWLRVPVGAGTEQDQFAPEIDQVTVESPAEAERREAAYREHRARTNEFALARTARSLIVSIHGRVEGIRELGERTFSSDDAAQLTDQIVGTQRLLETLYPVGGDTRERDFDLIAWELVPDAVVELRDRLQSLRELSDRAGNVAKFHSEQASKFAEMLLETYLWWTAARDG